MSYRPRAHLDYEKAGMWHEFRSDIIAASVPASMASHERCLSYERCRADEDD
jgi:hypothetical protein